VMIRRRITVGAVFNKGIMVMKKGRFPGCQHFVWMSLRIFQAKLSRHAGSLPRSRPPGQPTMRHDAGMRRIPIFGRTKVQGIIDHFQPASLSSHANLSAEALAKAEAGRRRKPCDGGELPIRVFFHFWLD
jgi:hypothetical protein